MLVELEAGDELDDDAEDQELDRREAGRRQRRAEPEAGGVGAEFPLSNAADGPEAIRHANCSVDVIAEERDAGVELMSR